MKTYDGADLECQADHEEPPIRGRCVRTIAMKNWRKSGRALGVLRSPAPARCKATRAQRVESQLAGGGGRKLVAKLTLEQWIINV